MQWEHKPECLGPKCNRVLGGGEHASERVKRRRYERLLETTRFEVFTPGLAAREQERSGAARTLHWVLPERDALLAGDSRADLRIIGPLHLRAFSGTNRLKRPNFP